MPTNAGPGSVMTVRAPTGATCRVTVPPSVYAGQSFEFEYDDAPPAPAHRPAYQPPPPSYDDPSYRQQAPAPPYGGAAPTPSGTLMRVVVPAGVSPGASLTVNVPGRGPHRVTVPAGVYGGQSFQFRVQ